MKFKKKDIFNIPNILTYIRILCVPFFIWISLDKNLINDLNIRMMIALGIFLFASFTDVIDGKIARKYNLISDIGKVLDPFADKFLQVSAVICLSIVGNLHYSFAIILFLKEGYMVIAASLLLKKISKDIEIKANFYGKIAAVFNAIGIILCFFHNYEQNHLYYLDWVFLGIGCLLAIFAAVMYSIQIINQIKLLKNKE